MTIREFFRWAQIDAKDHDACEWEPLERRPARLDDDFHGLAEVSIGRLSKDSAKKDRRLRVCRACSEEPECAAYATPFGSARIEAARDCASVIGKILKEGDGL